MTPERDYRLLKKLSLEFVADNDPDIFIGIALLVDKLLFYYIHAARKAKPYLRKVELDDLYQDAILGLYAAILKTKKDEPGSKIIYRIWRYVNNEITKQNRRTNKLIFPLAIGGAAFQVHLYASDMPQSKTYIKQILNALIDNTPVCGNLEAEIMKENLQLLVAEDVISSDELVMINMCHVDGEPYRVIAKKFGVSITTVSRKIKNALNRLRYEFRVRGWEDGYEKKTP